MKLYFQIIWSEEMEQKLSDLFKTYFMKVKNIISFIQDRGVEYSRKEISLISVIFRPPNHQSWPIFRSTL